jgi:hypothetical protein
MQGQEPDPGCEINKAVTSLFLYTLHQLFRFILDVCNDVHRFLNNRACDANLPLIFAIADVKKYLKLEINDNSLQCILVRGTDTRAYS